MWPIPITVAPETSYAKYSVIPTGLGWKKNPRIHMCRLPELQQTAISTQPEVCSVMTLKFTTQVNHALLVQQLSLVYSIFTGLPSS